MSLREIDIYEIIANALNCLPATLGPDAGLNRHPDWDSMGQIQIIVALEQRLGISIDDERILELTDIPSIIKFCKKG